MLNQFEKAKGKKSKKSVDNGREELIRKKEQIGKDIERYALGYSSVEKNIAELQDSVNKQLITLNEQSRLFKEQETTALAQQRIIEEQLSILVAQEAREETPPSPQFWKAHLVPVSPDAASAAITLSDTPPPYDEAEGSSPKRPSPKFWEK
jgi:hypothetical protein